MRLQDRPLATQFAWIVATGGLLLVLGDTLVGAFLRSGETTAEILLEAGLSFVLLIPSAYLLLRLYRSIARPLGALTDSIRRYQDGDLTARVTPSSAVTSEIGYLERSFNSLGDRIERMVGRLKEVDRMKTDFVSTVSHELKTPLTAISGYVRLLLSGDAGPISTEQTEFLRIVDSNAVRLTSLINDLLDVSQLEASRTRIERTRFDLRDVLHEFERNLKLAAEVKGLAFTVRPPADPLPLRADRDRVLQALINVGSNAIKYTLRGRVEIQARSENGRAVVEIADTGIGMSRDEQSRLFEKFFRARSAPVEKESGTGLGLVIARGWIEANDGTIMIDSAHGEGTRVFIGFPLATPEAVSKAEREVSGILLVQSDADLRGILARAFERRGYSVEQLDQGRFALERLRAGNYRAAIIDAELGDLSGTAVAQTWRADTASGKFPVFVIGKGTEFQLDSGLDSLVRSLTQAIDRYSAEGSHAGANPDR